jgi:hypothetical protein
MIFNTMSSYPEQLYDSIKEALIDRFIAEGQEENLHLDFKSVRTPVLGRDDRLNLGIALSSAKAIMNIEPFNKNPSSVTA